MSRAVQTQIPFLELVQSTSVKQRKALLQTLTKDQFYALSEIILNVYKGTVPVSDYYVKKLLPFKRSIQMMTQKHVSGKRKKKLLVTKHAMLPLLIKPVLSMLKEGPDENGLDSELGEYEDKDL